jgi:hypothetical protein
MNLTFLSAYYANEENTVAIARTEDGRSVVISINDTPDMWASMLTQIVPTAYIPSPPPMRSIAKTTIYRRATDQELALLEATLPTLPLRDRMMWQDAVGGTVYAEEVMPFFVAAVGQARATELLA